MAKDKPKIIKSGNFIIDVDNKTIKVTIDIDKLSDEENMALNKNLEAGYVLLPYIKRKTLTKNFIINYLDVKEKEDIKKAFEAELDKEIINKDGKKRKAGFLVARQWLNDNHKDLYEEMKKKLKGE